MACKLSNLNDPSQPGVSSNDDHTQVMTTLPQYCKLNPEDRKAHEQLFRHTYTHLHSWIYDENRNPYQVTQAEYIQECYLAFWKRLQTFKPEKCRDNKGWYGVIGFIRKDVERTLLHRYSKHVQRKASDKFIVNIEARVISRSYGYRKRSVEWDTQFELEQP